MSSLALINGRVLTDNGFEDGIAVLVEDGCIAALATSHEASRRADEVHDLQGATLLPGFIDCQVNGGGGVLFNNSPTSRRCAASGPRTASLGPRVSCRR